MTDIPEELCVKIPAGGAKDSASGSDDSEKSSKSADSGDKMSSDKEQRLPSIKIIAVEGVYPTCRYQCKRLLKRIHPLRQNLIKVLKK